MFSGTVTVLVGLSANLATNTVSAMPPWWTPVVWSLLGALAVLALALEVVKTRRSEPAGPLREAEEFLATAVRRQWTDEALLRGVYGPRPLPVRFHVTRRKGISDHPAAVVDDERLRGVPGAPRPRLTGEVTRISSAFRSIPARRLVVLGDAGSGKSVLAMLLTKSLLENRDAAEPVPILLVVRQRRRTRDKPIDTHAIP
ncbi:hypothetical protein [Amycolatopsis sp. lyj-23]|uniref:hypothetical protein n=1 Tax=Amycolatopsis sp. lyj-23 TaxID=2789283 RepID=UPI003979633C